MCHTSNGRREKRSHVVNSTTTSTPRGNIRACHEFKIRRDPTATSDRSGAEQIDATREDQEGKVGVAREGTREPQKGPMRQASPREWRDSAAALMMQWVDKVIECLNFKAVHLQRSTKGKEVVQETAISEDVSTTAERLGDSKIKSTRRGVEQEFGE